MEVQYSKYPLHPSQQTTIDASDTPKHLVLTLKKAKEGIEKQENVLKEKLDNNINTFAGSQFAASTVGKSMLGSMISNKKFDDSWAVESLDFDSEDELEAEELLYENEDIQEGLTLLNEEKNAYDNGIKIAETQTDQKVQVGNLELIGHHLKKIAKAEGTTLLSALVTGGAGIAALATAPLVIGGTIAAATTVISAVEIFKMLSKYADSEGAPDPFMAIGNALNNIEKYNEQAVAIIKQAQEKQHNLHQKMGEIDSELEETTNALQSATGELKEALEKIAENLKQNRRALNQQSHDLNQAISLTQKAMHILKNQSDQLNTMPLNTYDIKNEKDLEAVVEKINEQIATVKLSSDDAYGILLEVTKHLLKSNESHKELVSIAHEYISLYADLKEVKEKLEITENKLAAANKKVADAEKMLGEKDEKLTQLEELEKKRAQETKLAKDQLEKAKQNVGFGAESALFGGGTAGTTGATIGFALGGPVGALMGAGIGFAGLGHLAIRGVHKYRKAQRANELAHKEKLFEKLVEELKSGKPVGNVAVKAEYGTTEGHYVGSASYKSAYNIISTGAQKLGKDIGEYKSSRAGTVICTIGSFPLEFKFDRGPGYSSFYEKTSGYWGVNFILGASDEVEKRKAAHEAYIQYGALSVPDQQLLSIFLIEELKKGTISPEMVLDLLDKLSQVHIGNEVIVMVTQKSLVMENLKALCNQLFKNKS